MPLAGNSIYRLILDLAAPYAEENTGSADPVFERLDWVSQIN